MIVVVLGVLALFLILIARLRHLDLLGRLRTGFWLVAVASFALTGIELLGDPEPWRRWSEVLLLLALGYVGARVIILVLVDWLLAQRAGVEVPRLGRDIVALLVYLVMAAVVLRAALGIEVGALLATSAVLTVVIGLALQETLGTLLAGLALAWEKRMSAGEWIEIDGIVGCVEELGWRSLVIRTRLGERVLVPNSSAVRQRVLLLGQGGSPVAVSIRLDVAYASPPDLVKVVLASVASAIPGLVDSPAPKILVHEFAASGITYEVRLWTLKPWQDFDLKDVFLTRAYAALAREGMEIPFPQRTVHLARSTEIRDEPGGRRDVLASCSLFAGLPEHVIAELAVHSRRVRFVSGEYVVREGESSDALYVIAGGGVVIKRRSTELGRLGPGEMFGERALLTGEPRSADVRAVGVLDVVEVASLALVQVVEEFAELADELAERMAARDPMTGEPSGPLLLAPEKGGLGAQIREHLRRLVGR